MYLTDIIQPNDYTNITRNEKAPIKGLSFDAG